jgi:hypothetical protein
VTSRPSYPTGFGAALTLVTLLRWPQTVAPIKLAYARAKRFSCMLPDARTFPTSPTRIVPAEVLA